MNVLFEIFFPVSIFILSLYIYSHPMSNSVYGGYGAWLMDVFAVTNGFILSFFFSANWYIYAFGSVVWTMHLAKALVKIKKQVVKSG
jgi:hypothetical protein